VEKLTPHVVITGASSGIGRAGADELERRGWRVTRIGRNPSRVGPGGLVADFAELAEVRELAARLHGERIDVLVNNAGLIAKGSTVDGYDATMQVNYLAPFLLTYLLWSRLRDGARIINTASTASNFGANPNPPGRRFPSAWLAYGTSKRANIWFAAEAARRWPRLRSYSFHPGLVRTRFGTLPARLFYRFAPGLSTPEQGADQLVWLSTADEAELVNGGYYVRRRPASTGPEKEVASRLWDATCELLGLNQ
jgi:NAD(P)-dependent dehydrogenase (short-subunit alcohol dehydrogenase family)